MTRAPSDRLLVHRNPLWMFFSAGPWAATAYLAKVAAAQPHRKVARSLPGPRIDPLAAAEQMPAEPGPLIA
jgi:hypothetical protein